MDISGKFTFDAPQASVWQVLQDPAALATIIPMAMNMKRVGENQYTGTLFFRVADVAGTFHGKITLTNMQPPNSYDIEVQGNSPIGNVNIKGGMHLESTDNQTTMFYQGKIQFGGRIASVGSRLLDMAIRSIMQQSFKLLAQYLNIKNKKN